MVVVIISNLNTIDPLNPQKILVVDLDFEGSTSSFQIHAGYYISLDNLKITQEIALILLINSIIFFTLSKQFKR